MALPVISNIYRCTLDWAASSGITYMHNVMHVECDIGNEDNVFDALDGAVSTDMWHTAPTGFAVQTVEVLALDGVSASHTYDTGRASKWSGSGSGQWIPAACGIVTLYSAERGRSKRGRQYIPMSEGMQDSGAVDPSAVVAMQGAWESFIASLSGVDIPLVVASYTHVSTAPVVSPLVRSLMGTQRRRQKRLGIA